MDRTSELVIEALSRLDSYCTQQDFKGWDLFDGLNSSLFRRTPFFNSRLIRLAWIQAFKRSPINFRHIAGVPKQHNPKGLALFAAGKLNQKRIEEGGALLEILLASRCPDYKHACWGYNFPWEAKAFYVPRGKPNMVTTVFAAQSLLQGYAMTGNDSWLSAARSACDFILESLILEEDGKSLCFGYIPGENARVHNANLLGAALLGQLYAITGETILLEKSTKSVAYTMHALDKNGLWPYGERDHHRFVDNFHTGYNLVSMDTWMRSTGDFSWKPQLLMAMDAYANTFWLADGTPKYYHDRLYPIDIHCSAQGILTFLRFKDIRPEYDKWVELVALWAVSNMQDESGYFYYQVTRFYTNRIPYMRWSQAWMYLALSSYCRDRGLDVEHRHCRQ